MVVAFWRVPSIVARRPRQSGAERGDEVIECPGDDDVIEEVRVEGYQYHRTPDTWRHSRAQTGYRKITCTSKWQRSSICFLGVASANTHIRNTFLDVVLIQKTG